MTCASCGSWTYIPRLNAADQAAIHDSSEYFDHPYFELRRRAAAAQRRRCRDLFARLSAGSGNRDFRGERLLDIGCDTGMFLAAAAEDFGIIPTGIDIAERAVQEARRKGLDVYHTSLDDAPPDLSGFGLATAIDLIEHVPDPGAFLQEVRRRLRPGGYVYLETPNIRSLVYRFGQALSAVTGGRPAGLLSRLFPPQHIQYFTPPSLHHMATQSGFEVARIATRVLPAADIATSPLVRLPMGMLQACDRVLGTEILIYAVLRRPPDNSSVARFD